MFSRVSVSSQVGCDQGCVSGGRGVQGDGVSGGLVCTGGVSGEGWWHTLHPRYSQTAVRYASYWNAFLFVEGSSTPVS